MKEKLIYTTMELVKQGYPKSLLDSIKYSKDFPDVGFTNGNRKYFNIKKLDEFLESKENARIKNWHR